MGFEEQLCSAGDGEGEESSVRLGRLASLAESMIEASYFAPNEQGFYCGNCPHQDACRNWHVAVTRTRVRLAA